MTLEECERAIARMLKQLEVDTRSTVDSIEVRTMDVTTIMHDRSHHMRSVRITLRPQPGAHWEE